MGNGGTTRTGDEETAKDTKARIVLGALRGLQKQGLAPLSYDVIAAEAETTRQLVRYHFPDPERLMVAVCDELAAVYRQLLVENAARLEGPGRLEMFLDFYFDLLEGAAKPRDDRAYDAVMSLATGSEAVRGCLRGQYSLLGQVIAHEINATHPELSARATEELAYTFVCLMYGHWKMVASLGFSEAHNRVSRATMDRLIRSYIEAGDPVDPASRIWALEG